VSARACASLDPRQGAAGIGAVQTSAGRHINVGPDGIVEMSEEDAFYLIPVGWTILGDA
jgi:hypothetical protein